MSEQEPKRETIESYCMNIITHRAEVIAAISQIEGEIWIEEERENKQYSVDSAIKKAIAEGEGEIYGHGGTHRYFVRKDGSVYYGEDYGRLDADRARALGFKMLNEAPARWSDV
jgi:hypothetical protein